MTPEILAWALSVAHLIPDGLNAVEIGSLDVNGSIRQILQGKCALYTGVDSQEGNGVDVVADGLQYLKSIAYKPELILCCECLEHDPNAWLTIHGMRDTLAAGGYLLVTSPAYGFPYHGYPKDYWRMSKDTFIDVIFAGYEVLSLDVVGLSPYACTVGLARKPHGD